MNHDATFPDPSVQDGPDAPASAQSGRHAAELSPSPGLAAMTRRYIDGEISLVQLLAFDR